jgi:hypothetical protein
MMLRSGRTQRLWSDTDASKGDTFRGSDFPDDEDRLTLTIRGVVMHEATIDFEKKIKGECEHLEFEEDSRLLRIKKQNGDKLAEWFGDDMNAWAGQVVALGGKDYGQYRGVVLHKAKGRPRSRIAEEPAGNRGEEDLEPFDAPEQQPVRQRRVLRRQPAEPAPEEVEELDPIDTRPSPARTLRRR